LNQFPFAGIYSKVINLDTVESKTPIGIQLKFYNSKDLCHITLAPMDKFYKMGSNFKELTLQKTDFLFKKQDRRSLEPYNSLPSGIP
jgi:hypothetical protein